jgi:hypothetical protein
MELTYKVFSADVKPTLMKLTLADKSQVEAIVPMLNVQLTAPGQGTVTLVLPPTKENNELFLLGAEVVSNFTPGELGG